MYDQLLGVGITKINGNSEDGSVTDTPRVPIPEFRITRYYRVASVIGKPNEELEVTVTQAGKDSAWALELAERKEFHSYEEDGWVRTKTVIEQIGTVD